MVMAMDTVARTVATAMRVALVMLMAVVPQLGFVQQKEEHDANQQGREQLLGARLALEGLGKQMHEGSGQKRTGCEAQQVLRADAAWPIITGAAEKAEPHQARGKPD